MQRSPRTADLLSTQEAADLLNLHRSTLSRRAKAGRIEYVRKLGAGTAGYLFDRAYIETLAQGQDAAA